MKVTLHSRCIISSNRIHTKKVNTTNISILIQFLSVLLLPYSPIRVFFLMYFLNEKMGTASIKWNETVLRREIVAKMFITILLDDKVFTFLVLKLFLNKDILK